MLSKLIENYKTLIKSDEFKNEGFFCGAFLICEIENLDKTDWQIDFYNPESDTMTTYLIGKEIEVTDNSEVFKDDKTRKIEEVKLKEVKTDMKDMKKELDKILKKYNETAEKITVILQNEKTPVWNIIYITKRFNIINIKINAVDGKVIEDKTMNILSFDKGE